MWLAFITTPRGQTAELQLWGNLGQRGRMKRYAFGFQLQCVSLSLLDMNTVAYIRAELHPPTSIRKHNETKTVSIGIHTNIIIVIYLRFSHTHTHTIVSSRCIGHVETCRMNRICAEINGDTEKSSPAESPLGSRWLEGVIKCKCSLTGQLWTFDRRALSNTRFLEIPVTFQSDVFRLVSISYAVCLYLR